MAMVIIAKQMVLVIMQTPGTVGVCFVSSSEIASFQLVESSDLILYTYNRGMSFATYALLFS